MSTERLVIVLMIAIVILGFQSCFKPAGSLSEVMEKLSSRR